MPDAALNEQLTNIITDMLPPILKTLESLELAQRHLQNPTALGRLSEELTILRPAMTAAAEAYERAKWPDHLRGFAERLGAATRETHGALERCIEAGSVEDGFVQWVRAMRGRTRAMEALYPFSAIFTPVSWFFLESAARNNPDIQKRVTEGMARSSSRGSTSLNDESGNGAGSELRVGFLNASNDRKERGGFTLYVPEYYEPDRSWPLVVALHGGSGHGADFVWTWLREARGRGFIVLAPTAQEGTWSLMGPDVDAEPLHRMVEYVCEHWHVDRERMLLTGMSDGGTYTSLIGLAPNSPFTAIAPLCGMFHPLNYTNGNMAQVPGRRIYLLHGALDWMFAVNTVQLTRDQLVAAKADLTYREVPDLGHTYPRDENDGILRWFDASLALP